LLQSVLCIIFFTLQNKKLLLEDFEDKKHSGLHLSILIRNKLKTVNENFLKRQATKVFM